MFRPGGVADGNVFTSWPLLMDAMATVQGVKLLQFDDTLASPCVIPAGTWDMTNIEWTAFLRGVPPAGTAVSLGGSASGGDVILPNLRSFGGSLNPLTNRNSGSAPVVIPAVSTYAIESGEGFSGDFPQINNVGPAPFFDASALGAGQTFLLRMQGAISGSAPAIQMGASPGVFSVSLFDAARIHSGMIEGTNPAAQIQISNFGMSGQVNRQPNFTGTILYGRPNAFAGVVGWPRLWMFPASVNQSSPSPSTVPITPAAGLGMNTYLRFNTSSGLVAQTLPIIRAVSPPIGSFSTTPGSLESTGLVVIVKNEVGNNVVSVSPDPTGPDTIDGASVSFLVAPGQARMFISNGVNNWSVFP